MMIDIVEVKSKKDIKEFIRFPLRLYKGVPSFVPMLYADEKKLLLSGGKTDTSEAVFFLAKKDGKTVGRIQGIWQKQANALKNEKKVRFTRFDAINDTAVSRALFGALEAWATGLGMDTVCGPLGYSDLDREGLLIEGFSEESTYEEQYNYDYYPALLEDYGFGKDVDWLEFELTAPQKKNEMLARVAERTLTLNKLHIADRTMPKKQYIAKYADSFFDTLDICYSKLYGVMPITEAQRRELISQFETVINIKYSVFICNEKEEVVALGLCFPAFGDVIKKNGGRLTPLALIRLLHTIKHPKKLDLGLVAVRPEYQNSGVNAVILSGLVDMLMAGDIQKCETNLNLETNVQVMAQWKYFTARQHKKRRAYIKKIGEDKNA